MFSRTIMSLIPPVIIPAAVKQTATVKLHIAYKLYFLFVIECFIIDIFPSWTW
jgi:hypothetical protein